MSDPKKSLEERMDEMPGLRERFEAILTIAEAEGLGLKRPMMRNKGPLKKFAN